MFLLCLFGVVFFCFLRADIISVQDFGVQGLGFMAFCGFGVSGFRGCGGLGLTIDALAKTTSLQAPTQMHNVHLPDVTDFEDVNPKKKSLKPKAQTLNPSLVWPGLGFFRKVSGFRVRV